MAETDEIEQTQEKKKRTVHRRTKEQRMFKPWVIEHLIPMVKDQLTYFEKFCTDYESGKIVEHAAWEELKSVVLSIIEHRRNVEELYFNIERLEAAKWSEKHTSLYFIRADESIRYALKQIVESRWYDPEDEKEARTQQVYFYRCLTHLYSFLTTQDK